MHRETNGGKLRQCLVKTRRNQGHEKSRRGRARLLVPRVLSVSLSGDKLKQTTSEGWKGRGELWGRDKTISTLPINILITSRGS